jgi:2-polyprenyl-3-methyl-5-hydroxy-6-metoxy-1,4-benzoquinol methylase
VAEGKTKPVENKSPTREPQGQRHQEVLDKIGITKLGICTNQIWYDYPRLLCFMLSRYKFVSKMLSGKKRVLEVGCGDAFCTRIVLAEVGEIVAIDYEPLYVNDALARMDENWTFECRVHDMIEGPIEGEFDAAYSIDVIEHIPRDREDRFMSNVLHSLADDAVMIVGTPSLQSQVYASPWSKAAHINCKDHQGLKDLMERYFQNVFVFSMNDEMVHTGFYPMAHYLFAMGVGKKR